MTSCWYNSSTGGVAIWFLTNGVQTGGAGVGGAPLDWQIQGIGDFDADGHSDDILWYNSNTGGVATWSLTNGAQTGVTAVGGAPDGWWVG